MPTYCEGAKSARVLFKYEGGSYDNIVSRNPPVTVTTEQKASEDSKGKCDGVVYSFDVWIQHNEYKEYNLKLGNFTYWGPIGKISFKNYPQLGEGQIWLETRGDDNNQILPFADRVFYYLGPNYTPRIENLVRLDGQPDDCGNSGGTCVFTVSDSKGQLFKKEAEKCPEYYCECDNDCPPGTVKCGDCCLPCEAIKSSIKAARQAVRNL